MVGSLTSQQHASGSSSSSRLSDGNSSLLGEGGSASRVPKLAGCESVVWPDSLSEWLVDGAGLQQKFCCLTASNARALLCVADAEFGLQCTSVSQGRICSDNCICCHTEKEAADQACYLSQSQYTDTGPTSPSADPIRPGSWQDSHRRTSV